MSKIKKILFSQWSFFWAWIVFGIAQIIYMGGHLIDSLIKGKDLVSIAIKPITVTTDLGKMFRALEVAFYKLTGLPDFQLYGKAIEQAGEWISATWWAFYPGIGWQIIWMAIGGFIVVMLEKEPRIWAKYPLKLLIVSFIGWMIFSYGTRLAWGCTLNHLLWGVPMMNIHSSVALIFMALWWLAAFWLMVKLRLANYFKHQETKCYVKHEWEKWNKDRDGVTYDPNYNPWKRVATWLWLTFMLALFGVALYGGIANPEWMQYLKNGDLHAMYKSIDHKWWFWVFVTLLAGIVGWFAMAKSWFGTECALVAAEMWSKIAKNESKFRKLGLPNITLTLFKWMLPLQWVAASWLLVTAFVLIFWWFLGAQHWFSDPSKYKYFLTLGVPIGWFLLGAWAVLLIWCEIRSYMRLGMLYLNTLIGFIGFAVGYLPFTLFYKQHTAFLNWTIPGFLKENQIFTWPDLFAYWFTGKSDFVAHSQWVKWTISTSEFWATHIVALIVALIWFAGIVWILIWTFRFANKYLKLPNKDIMNENTEAVHLATVGEDYNKVCPLK